MAISPKIIIDSFNNGIQQDPTLQLKNGCFLCEGMDIDNELGCLRVGQQLSAMDMALGVGGISALATTNITWFQGATGTGHLWGAAGAFLTNFDYDVAGKWASAYAEPNINAGDNLINFNDRLWWTTNKWLNQYDGAGADGNFNTSAYAFSAGDAYHPSVIFNGELMIGDGRYVFTLSDTSAKDGMALDLPTDYRIKSMAVYGNRLLMGTWIDAFTENASLFSWDGSSESYEQYWYLKEPGGVNAMYPYKNFLVIFAGYAGNIYVFDGANIEKIAQIPNLNSAAGEYAYLLSPYSITEYCGKLVFGTYSNPYGTQYTADKIWSLERKPNGGWVLSSPHIPSVTRSASNARNINFLYSGYYNQLYVGYKQATEPQKIEKINTSYRYVSSSFQESLIYEIAPGMDPVDIKGIEVIAKPLATGNSIVLKYKIDNASVWTTWGTITSANQKKICKGIKGPGKTIQLRLEFTTTGTDNYTPEVSSIRIY